MHIQITFFFITLQGAMATSGRNDLNNTPGIKFLI